MALTRPERFGGATFVRTLRPSCPVLQVTRRRVRGSIHTSLLSSKAVIAIAMMTVVPFIVGVVVHRQSVLAAVGESPLGFATVDENSAMHPLNGSWIVRINGHDRSEPPFLITFAAGGAVIVSQAPGSIAQGTWVANGERAATFTYVYIRTNQDGTFSGTTTYRGEAEVDETGDGWVTSSLVGEEAGRDEPASSGILFPASPQQLQATRIEIEPADAVEVDPEPGEPGYAPATPTP